MANPLAPPDPSLFAYNRLHKIFVSEGEDNYRANDEHQLEVYGPGDGLYDCPFLDDSIEGHEVYTVYTLNFSRLFHDARKLVQAPSFWSEYIPCLALAPELETEDFASSPFYAMWNLPVSQVQVNPPRWSMDLPILLPQFAAFLSRLLQDIDDLVYSHFPPLPSAVIRLLPLKPSIDETEVAEFTVISMDRSSSPISFEACQGFYLVHFLRIYTWITAARLIAVKVDVSLENRIRNLITGAFASPSYAQFDDAQNLSGPVKEAFLRDHRSVTLEGTIGTVWSHTTPKEGVDLARICGFRAWDIVITTKGVRVREAAAAAVKKKWKQDEQKRRRDEHFKPTTTARTDWESRPKAKPRDPPSSTPSPLVLSPPPPSKVRKTSEEVDDAAGVSSRGPYSEPRPADVPSSSSGSNSALDAREKSRRYQREWALRKTPTDLSRRTPPPPNRKQRLEAPQSPPHSLNPPSPSSIRRTSSSTHHIPPPPPPRSHTTTDLARDVAKSASVPKSFPYPALQSTMDKDPPREPETTALVSHAVNPPSAPESMGTFLGKDANGIYILGPNGAVTFIPCSIPPAAIPVSPDVSIPTETSASTLTLPETVPSLPPKVLPLRNSTEDTSLAPEIRRSTTGLHPTRLFAPIRVEFNKQGKVVETPIGVGATAKTSAPDSTTPAVIDQLPIDADLSSSITLAPPELPAVPPLPESHEVERAPYPSPRRLILLWEGVQVAGGPNWFLFPFIHPPDHPPSDDPNSNFVSVARARFHSVPRRFWDDMDDLSEHPEWRSLVRDRRGTHQRDESVGPATLNRYFHRFFGSERTTISGMDPNFATNFGRWQAVLQVRTYYEYREDGWGNPSDVQFR